MNRFRLLQIIINIGIALVLITSCSDNEDLNQPNKEIQPFQIAIFSDPHYFDPDLGLPGPAFFDAKINSRKMIAESEAILNSAVESILSSSSDLVFIPGDLTKDGEKSSHIKFAAIISKLRQSGKKVFVVPGNHDVANPDAYGYNGDDKYRTETVSPEEFKQIYADFGYSSALYTDNNSLTYIAEPLPGVWVIAMDACRYKENTDRHVVGGKFNATTYEWIKEKIREGKSKGKIMFGILHHGLLEHFEGQKENPISADFVIDDYKNISREFSELGLNFVFTGHFHANDVVSANYENNFIYDIETGSLLTYPVPYRFINVKSNGDMEITTNYVQNVDVNTGGKAFQQYAKDYLTNDLDKFVADILVSQFQLDNATANELAPIGIGAFTSHYRGDEIISKDAIDLVNKYSTSSNFAILLFTASVKSLYTDLNPQDNNITINLFTGKVVK